MEISKRLRSRKFFQVIQQISNVCYPIIGMFSNLASLRKKVTFHPQNSIGSVRQSIRLKVSSYTAVTHVVVKGTLCVHAMPFIIHDKNISVLTNQNGQSFKSPVPSGLSFFNWSWYWFGSKFRIQVRVKALLQKIGKKSSWRSSSSYW